MKIRPRNILYAATGVKFSSANAGGANWRQQVFNNYRQHLLDQLAAYGEAEDYGNWLNEMQSRHSRLYNKAKASGDWESLAYEDPEVLNYQHDYRGSQRFGNVKLNSDYNYDFNQTGIKTNQGTRYNIANPPSRTSGDYSRDNYNYNPDGLYSAITDDRRLLGRRGDWDENSEEFKAWQRDLNSKGWETYLDSDDYYKLRRINPTTQQSSGQQVSVQSGTSVTSQHQDRYGFDWSKIGQGLQKILGNPDLYAFGRLTGNLINNERVYDEQLKGIKPVLRQTYNTHRQVVGDEATKQAYYRRAVQGQSRAARPFTSDADRQMAYQMEAKRIGDELRAQGDLADNQEIRRTSDESNQHQWANAQRATEVANANTASINQADASKHSLLAQKHSAQWSSIDNFLKEIEYRKRQQLAEDQAIEDQIYMLGQDDFQYTPEYSAAYKKYNDVLKKHKKSDDNTYDLHPDVIKAKGEFQNKLKEFKRKQLLDYRNYRKRIGFIKSGTKISYKKKDDLLYKSTKDVVEHFRKMSKISSDAQNRKKPKIEKLTSHPKGTKKYQQGGVAPFTVYTPVSMGGESTRASQYDSSSKTSSKDNEGKETLDLMKSLFKEMLGKGLPVDVNAIYSQMSNLFSQYKAFGNELDTNDIALLYLQSMQQVNNAMHSKEVYDKAKAYATQNDSLSEFAVNALGHFVVQDTETGKLSTEKSWRDVLESGKNPITNQQLLNLRAYNPELVSKVGDNIIENVINNGMGINKIGAQIKALAGNIGSYDGKIEGLTQVESNRVKSGLQLLANAPDGYYKHTVEDKNQQTQIKAAISYITNMLSPSQRAILDSHGGADKLIPLFLASQENITHNVSFQPLTGKASDTNSNGKSNGKGGTDTPASVQFLLGNGYQETVEFNIGNSQSVKALGRFGILQDKEKNNLGQGSNFQDVSKSQFGPILDLDKATFGGTRLVSSGYSHIILNNSDCIGLDLPVKKDLSGNYVPDFQQLSIIEKAEEKIHNNKITNPQQINQIYRELGLPDKFDSNGNIIPQNYRRFAGIQVILDSKALKGGLPINTNEVTEADDEERELFIEEMKKNGNKDYDLSDGILWSSWGRDKLYKGTIFVPVREDIVAGYTSGGYPLDTDIPNNANQVALMQYAPKTQQYQKTPPLSSLK